MAKSKKRKKKRLQPELYEVRVTWMMSGTYFVAALDKAGAEQTAQDACALPHDQYYMGGSMEIVETEVAS